MKTFALLSQLVFFCFTFQGHVLGQYTNDHLLPSKRDFMMTVGTGIPYVGIAELSYGLSNRFSFGLLVGSTPIIPGYGFRIKAVIFSNSSNTRVYAKMPVLYYPETKGLGGEPWLLTWPSIFYEKKLVGDLRISGGLGVVAAACVNDLLGRHLEAEDHHRGNSDSHVHKPGEGFMGDIWNTAQFNFSMPIGNRWTFQTEFGLVFDGYRIADSAWVGRHPVILFIGLSHTL